ncbi:gp57 [Rhodococcus phage ReqiPine5]|uniref:Gp57 n=1 Tax=Rhodococcus phage ReqiPine5 TaxID=691963 RepID=D4P832_9CAUD|nr:gp57 [Rhodococcus phage ReqiPine5]ADD81162.1 gp57 [Rhodococcus phage ReqiPine5]
MSGPVRRPRIFDHDDIENRHHLHLHTVDDVLAILAKVPDGEPVQLRTGMNAEAAKKYASRLRSRMGVDFYVRIDPPRRKGQDPNERVFSVWIRRRLATEPIIRAEAVVTGPHWKTMAEVLDATGLTRAEFAREHVRPGHIVQYRFGAHALFRTVDVDRLLAEHYNERPGGAIVAGVPTTERNRA